MCLRLGGDREGGVLGLTLLDLVRVAEVGWRQSQGVKALYVVRCSLGAADPVWIIAADGWFWHCLLQRGFASSASVVCKGLTEGRA